MSQRHRDRAVRILCWIPCLVTGLAAAPGLAGSSHDSPIQLARSMGEAEYRATKSAGNLQAANRQQDFRTYFDPTGIRVHSRTDGVSDNALLALRISGIGRGDTLESVGPGSLETTGGRVEIHRPGLVEWYENTPAGLEQGFTLAERPVGVGALTLEIGLERAGASLSPGGAKLVLVAAGSGRRLDYGHLEVWDRNGRTLPAHFELPSPQRIRLIVNDDGATYPLTIDPLLTATFDAQIHPLEAGAGLGFQVGSAGDVNGDGYDDVIVGAPYYDNGDGTNRGAVFIFHGSSSGIVASADPTNANTTIISDQAGAQLGWGAAGAGDVDGDGFDDIIVGAPYYDPTGSLGAAGSAFIYLGRAGGIASGTTATYATKLDSDLPGAVFASPVAGAGDVNGDGYDDVVVGAQGYDGDQGAAFIFHGSPTGVASADAMGAHGKVVGGSAGALLGGNLGPSGDVNGDGFSDVFLPASNYTGTSPAVHNQGSISIFHGSGSGITKTGTIATADTTIVTNQVLARFGGGGIVGDVNGDGYEDALMGSYLYDGAAGQDSGLFGLFLGSASGIASGTILSADTLIESDQAFAELGLGSGAAGDVNGDGYADVIVTGWLYDGNGAAFIYFGGPFGIAGGASSVSVTAADVKLSGVDPSGSFGLTAGTAGDVNGDGSADVIVSDVFFGANDDGAAFVYHGIPDPSFGRAPSVTFAKIADFGSEIPGGTGNFTTFVDPAADGTDVAFTALGPSGQKGIYIDSGTGLSVVVDTSTPIPGGAGNFTSMGPVSLDGGKVALAGRGVSQEGIYSDAGGTLAVVADVNTPIPGGVGNFTCCFGEPSLEGTNVAFLGIGGSLEGVYLDTGAGPPTIVADTNDLFPGGAGNFNFFASTRLSSGTVCFEGFGSPSSQRGIYLGSGGPLTVVVDTNTAIPGGPGNFTGFGPPAFDGTTVAFRGDASTGPSTLYTGSGGPLMTVADTSMPIPDGLGLFTGFGQLAIEAGAVYFVGHGSSGQRGIYTNADGALTRVVDLSAFSTTLNNFELGPEAASGGRLAFKAGGGAYGGVFVDLPPFTLTPIALPGDTAPGTGLPYGTGISGARGQVISRQGEAVLLTFGATQGIFREDSGIGFPVVLVGDPLPPPVNGTWGASGFPSISSSGDVVFPGYAAGGSSPEAIFLDIAGSLSVVSARGETLPGIGAPWASLHLSPLVNDAGAVAFGAIATNGIEGIFLDLGGFTPDIAVAFEGQPAPAGGDYAEFLSHRLNNAGEVAFHGIMCCNPSEAHGIYLDPGAPGGPKTLVALGGFPAPTPDGFTGFESFDLNDVGDIVFKAYETSGLDGILLALQGSLSRLVSVGDLAPGTGGEAFAYVGYPSLDDAGNVAFDGSYGFAFTSVFLRDSSGRLLPVALEGQPAPGLPGDTLQNSRTLDMNDLGQVLLATQFASTSGTGIYLAWRSNSQVVVASGTPATGSIGGGLAVGGGFDYSFPTTSGGALVGSHQTIPFPNAAAVYLDPGSINFALSGDIVTYWEIEYDGVFTAPVTLTFGYDDSLFAPSFDETTLAIHHYVEPFPGCSNGIDCRWIELPTLALDTDSNQITVQTPSFSQFALGGPALGPSIWHFSGTAEGGTIDFTIGLVVLQVVTSPGQSAADVAAAVAGAINADATLSAAGITATLVGSGGVKTNGSVISSTINDSGISHVAGVPALAPGMVVVLVGVLLATSLWRKSRAQRAQSGEPGQ